jgi:galactoside O-acetyltransferase
MENIFFDISELKHCGKNVIIGKTVRIRKPHLVSIGDNSIIDDFTYIPCAMDIGSYSHIGANCSFIGGPGFVRIGSFVNIAPGCQIVTGTNDYRGGGLVGPTIPEEFAGAAVIEPVFIGDHCLLACQTIVLPGCSLPEGMATGAMTLLKKNEYSPWFLYAGIPGRKIGERDGRAILKSAKQLLDSNMA